MSHSPIQPNLYTLGTWKVKAGKEKEFISHWHSFSSWTSVNVSGAGNGHLLQDSNDPSSFISFGTWDNEDVVNQWRGTKEFQEFARKAKELCEQFVPHIMREVPKP